MKKLNVRELVSNGEVLSVGFDLTIIIDKDNEYQIVDNSVDDWHDFVDCDTLVIKRLDIEI